MKKLLLIVALLISAPVFAEDAPVTAPSAAVGAAGGNSSWR